MVTNPMGWYVTYHELGHSQLHSMYLGESEAYNNIYFAYIQNVKHNVNFDEAFKKSLHNPPLFTVDGAAINWMTTLNFRNGVDMDRTGSEKNEFRYQLRGYAKVCFAVLMFLISKYICSRFLFFHTLSLHFFHCTFFTFFSSTLILHVCFNGKQ